MDGNLILLLDDDNQPIFGDENTVLVKNTNDDTLFYISREAINLPAEFSSLPEPSINLTDSLDYANSQTDHISLSSFERELESESSRSHWTRAQVLQLIEKYKEHKHEFDNSCFRNETVWKKIATELGHHTLHEVQNKFKYLKSRYTKRKDNMRSTGAKALHFEFFEQFDEIFGHDPNITPIAVASSSRYDSTLDTISGEIEQSTASTPIIAASSTATLESNSTTIRNKKRKRDDRELIDILEKRELNRERRHQETMAALNKFNTLLEKSLEM